MIKDKIKNIKLRRLSPIEQILVLTLDESKKVYDLYNEKNYTIIDKNNIKLFTWYNNNRNLSVGFEMKNIYFRNGFKYNEINEKELTNLYHQYINPMNGKKTYNITH